MPSLAAIAVFVVSVSAGLLTARAIWANHLANRGADLHRAIENARCVQLDIDDLIGKGAAHG